MIVAHIEVSGVHANCVWRMTIPAGLIGGQVKIKYVDPVWSGMSKTAVFRGSVTKDVLNIDDLVTIPSEVVAKAGHDLWFGIYGVDASGKLAIPLIEAHLGKVAKATDPSGDETTDPSLPVWGQLQEQINDLKENGTGGYYTPAVTQPEADTLQFDFTPSKSDMPSVEPVQVKLPAGQGSGGNADLTIEGETLVIAENSTATIENETLIL